MNLSFLLFNNSEISWEQVREREGGNERERERGREEKSVPISLEVSYAAKPSFGGNFEDALWKKNFEIFFRFFLSFNVSREGEKVKKDF